MNKIIKIILILTIIIIIAGLVYFFVWSKQELVNNELNGAIDTSDWKIYRNDELGFEFQYPNNWDAPIISYNESATPGKKDLFICVFQSDKKASFQGGEAYGYKLTSDLNDNIELLRKHLTGDLYQRQVIDLTNGRAFYAKEKNTLYNETPHAYIISKHYIFSMVMLYDAGDSMTLEELFKKIISTFKFPE